MAIVRLVLIWLVGTFFLVFGVVLGLSLVSEPVARWGFWLFAAGMFLLQLYRGRRPAVVLGALLALVGFALFNDPVRRAVHARLPYAPDVYLRVMDTYAVGLTAICATLAAFGFLLLGRCLWYLGSQRPSVPQ